MLMYQFKAPHRPWTPNPKFNNLFKEDLPVPETFNDDYNGRIAAADNMMEIENHLNRNDLKIILQMDSVPESLDVLNNMAIMVSFGHLMTVLGRSLEILEISNLH